MSAKDSVHVVRPVCNPWEPSEVVKKGTTPEYSCISSYPLTHPRDNNFIKIIIGSRSKKPAFILSHVVFMFKTTITISSKNLPLFLVMWELQSDTSLKTSSASSQKWFRLRWCNNIGYNLDRIRAVLLLFLFGNLDVEYPCDHGMWEVNGMAKRFFRLSVSVQLLALKVAHYCSCIAPAVAT